MNKNKSKETDQPRKLRGIRLHRETIRILDDPALLGQVRGGEEDGFFSEFWPGCVFTTSGISQNPPC
jgi:hypothetical protein